MTPFLIEPPTPQRFLRRPASARTPSSSSGTSAMVVTALPRRPATSRRTFTRPPAAIRDLTFGSRALRRSPSLLDHTTLASRLAIAFVRRSVHVDEIHDEDQRLIGADDAAGAALAVGEHRRDRDPPPAADLHARDALVPARDDLALAETELERAPAVPGGVELLAGLPRDPDVVDLHDAPGDGLLAVTDGEVLELELVGGRLVGGNLDLGLLSGGHPGDGSCSSRAATAPRGRPRSPACRSARPGRTDGA